MDIIFETKGSTAALKQYLQAFKEIDDSLLLEIDLNDDLFIAKSFTTSKDIVKYGKISFEQCNMSVIGINDENNNTVSVSEWITKHPGRVYAGLLRTLQQVINIINLFSGEEVHKIIVRFDSVNVDKIGPVFQANMVEFKSRALNMVTTCYNLSEFNLNLVDDSKFFDVVANIPNPVSFEIGPNVNNTLIKVSEVYTKDPKKEIFSFNIANEELGWCLRAKDHNENHYDYCMSTHVVGETNENIAETVTPVSRQNYITSIKGDMAEASVITVSSGAAQNGRMKIETADGVFTTIIATIRV